MPETRDPLRIAIACFLAWAIPGSGHMYLGRVRKGVIFLVIVLMTFGIGIALKGRVYLASSKQPLSFLATFANVSVGPIDLIGRLASYDRIIYSFPSETDRDLYQEILDRQRARILAVTNEYGTTFLLTAGLMNLLLILDAFDLGIGRKT